MFAVTVAGGRGRVSPTRILALAIPLLYVLILAVFVLRKGDTDWDQMTAFHQLSLWNSKMFGFEKHWNPLMSGGMSLAGDPQVPIFSPSMMLTHVLPAAAALKLAVLLFLAVGWAGAYLLAGQLGLAPQTAALAASLFAGNGYILSRLSHGHLDFLGTLTLPLWLWALRAVVRAPGEPRAPAAWRLAAMVLAGGLLFALSTDGAPIVLLLLLVWVGLDAVVLTWQTRSARPLLFCLGAVVTAGFLNAIYYLPLVTNAVDFPRVRPAVFLDPLLFFWFLILPVRGKILPAPANGQEFSVYIGPVLAYLLVRYRRQIREAFSRETRQRFLLTSVSVFVIGLGAWKALAAWFPAGPFDLLHRLPGFETIGLPGRFWGFLALPLALGAAVALRALEGESSAARPRRLLWTGVFVFTLAFQAVSLAQPFITPRGRQRLRATHLPTSEIRVIENLGGPIVDQSQLIAPDRGVIEAYNNHDYVRGSIAPGSELVRQTRWTRGDTPLQAVATWEGWNKIILTLPEGGGPGAVIFNQNFHPGWRSSSAAVTRSRRGNLALRLARPVPPGTTVSLRFRDEYSILGRRISRVSAYLFLAMTTALVAHAVGSRRRARSTPACGEEPLLSGSSR